MLIYHVLFKLRTCDFYCSFPFSSSQWRTCWTPYRLSTIRSRRWRTWRHSSRPSATSLRTSRRSKSSLSWRGTRPTRCDASLSGRSASNCNVSPSNFSPFFSRSPSRWSSPATATWRCVLRRTWRIWRLTRHLRCRCRGPKAGVMDGGDADRPETARTCSCCIWATETWVSRNAQMAWRQDWVLSSLTPSNLCPTALQGLHRHGREEQRAVQRLQAERRGARDQDGLHHLVWVRAGQVRQSQPAQVKRRQDVPVFSCEFGRHFNMCPLMI